MKKKSLAIIIFLLITFSVIALTACTPFASDAPQGISLDERQFVKIRDSRMVAEETEYAGYIYKKDEQAMTFRMKSPSTLEEGAKYPMIIFLHGRGDGGTDNSRHMYRSFINSIKENVKEDCYVFMPQASDKLDWTQFGGRKATSGMSDLYNACLDELIAKYPIDTNRVYLTGMSMGGNGTVYQAYNYPEKYAAIMPLCGYFPLEMFSDITRLKDMPTWLSHSKTDDAVDYKESATLYSRLSDSGNKDVLFYSIEKYKHDITQPFYEKADVWTWLMSKSKA